MKKRVTKTADPMLTGYASILSELVDLLEGARRISARAVNAVMTASYWEVGRRIVEFEQGGKRRAGYGEALVERLSADLSARFGRGFSLQNLYKYRQFFLTFPEILPTVSGKSVLGKLPTLSGESASSGGLPDIFQTVPEKSGNESGLSNLRKIAVRFPLPWSNYVRLLGVRSDEARKFYETEALRCGWTVRQLDRQISTQFYERTGLSRNKAAMLKRSGKGEAGDAVTPDGEIKDPFVLEFLGLKDEYSESDLEGADSASGKFSRRTRRRFRLCRAPAAAANRR